MCVFDMHLIKIETHLLLLIDNVVPSIKFNFLHRVSHSHPTGIDVINIIWCDFNGWFECNKNIPSSISLKRLRICGLWYVIHCCTVHRFTKITISIVFPIASGQKQCPQTFFKQQFISLKSHCLTECITIQLGARQWPLLRKSWSNSICDHWKYSWFLAIECHMHKFSSFAWRLPKMIYAQNSLHCEPITTIATTTSTTTAV